MPLSQVVWRLLQLFGFLDSKYVPAIISKPHSDIYEDYLIICFEHKGIYEKFPKEIMEKKFRPDT